MSSSLCLCNILFPIFITAALSSRSLQQYKIGLIDEFMNTTVVAKSHSGRHVAYTVPNKAIKITFGKKTNDHANVKQESAESAFFQTQH